MLKMLEAVSGDHRFVENIISENQKGEKVEDMCIVLDKAEARGEARGITQGIIQGEVSFIRKKLAKHMTIPSIVDILELEEDYVTEIVKLIEADPELTDVEIAEKYLAVHA